LSLGATLSGNRQGSLAYVEAAFLFQEGAGDLTEVSGLDLSAELDTVQTTVYYQMAFEYLRKELAGTLGHDLTENHAGHNGVTGKMSAAKERVFRNLEPGVTHSIIAHFCPVQQEHGLPVGDEGFDLFLVHYPL
jgi:hypothetical protein